jgi:hypothetical protein
MEAEDWGEKFVIEEYKALWDYYKRTLDERHKLLDYYYKTVPIPAALIAILTTSRIDTTNTFIAGDRVLQIASASFAVIFLVGIVTFTTYVKEGANARRYEAALNKIRERFRNKDSSIKNDLIIGDLRALPVRLGRIATWRGLIFVVLNSAIGVAATGTAIQGLDYYLLIPIFALLICIQSLWGWLIRRVS